MEDNLIALRGKAESSEAIIRREVANDLVFIEHSDAVELLLNLALDENKGVREAAADGLLRRVEPNVLKRLVEFLGNPRIEIRNQAMTILVEIGERAVDYVETALFDSDKDVRKFAADILGDIKSLIAVPALIKAVDDEDLNVCSSAIEALGKIGGDIAISALTEAFSQKPEIRAFTAETIGKLGYSEAASVVHLGLKDDDPLVVYAATEALGKMGTKSEIALLKELIENSEGFLKGVTFASYLKIARRDNTEIEVNVFSPENIDAFNFAVESDGKIAEFAEELIEKFAGGNELPNLEEVFHSLGERMKLKLLEVISNKTGETARNLVWKALDDSDASVRMNATQLSMKWRDQTTIEKLAAMLDDDDEWVGFRAAESIGLLRENSAAIHLVQRVEKANPLQQVAIVKALAALEAEEELKDLAHSDSLTDDGVISTLNELLTRFNNASS